MTHAQLNTALQNNIVPGYRHTCGGKLYLKSIEHSHSLIYGGYKRYAVLMCGACMLSVEEMSIYDNDSHDWDLVYIKDLPVTINQARAFYGLDPIIGPELDISPYSKDMSYMYYINTQTGHDNDCGY